MIDLRLLREDPDLVRASQVARGDDPHLVDQVLDADARRRSALTEFETVRAEQKSLGKQVARAQGEEKQALLTRTKHLAEQVKALQADAAAAETHATELSRRISNVVEDGVPAGGEDDYVVLKHVGERPAFDFPVRDHLELGEGLAAIDTERGAKVSGARFYYLTGIGARLELALLNAAVDKALAAALSSASSSRAPMPVRK